VKRKVNGSPSKVDHPLFDLETAPLLRSGGRLPTHRGPRLDWLQALGGGLIGAGFISLIVGYVGISGTTKTYDQLTYFLSNGIGGAAAIIVGSTVLIIREHRADRWAIRLLDERLADIDHRIPMTDASGRAESRPAGSAASNSGVHNATVGPAVQRA
jgi:hypothetical protein